MYKANKSTGENKIRREMRMTVMQLSEFQWKEEP